MANKQNDNIFDFDTVCKIIATILFYFIFIL